MPLTTTSPSLVTYQDALQWAEKEMVNAQVYFGHGTDNAWDEAVALLLYAADLTYDCDVGLLQEKISTVVADRFIALVKRRIEERKPAAYLVGKAWFAGLEFYSDERALVPRSPIAELILRNFQPWLSEPPESVLDLCCGSGCIGIAAAVQFPDSRLVLTDLSQDALDLAKKNVQGYQLDNDTDIVQGDLFSALAGQTFDLILSNPPYVDKEDLAGMPQEYLHEPAMGLGSGDDGLDITRRILSQAANYLTDNGILIVEVGNSWEALEAAYPKVPFVWMEMAQGGHGVFMLHKSDLISCF